MNEPTREDLRTIAGNLQRHRDAEVIRANVLTYVQDRMGRPIAASSQVTVLEALLRLEHGCCPRCGGAA